MKRILFIAIGLLLNIAVHALDAKPPRDLISRFRPGLMWFYAGVSPYDSTLLRKYNRVVFDVFHTTMHNKFKSQTFDWRSIGFRASIMIDKPLTKGNTVGLGYGITFTHSDFFTRANIERDYVNGTTRFSDSLIPASEHQKLSANYLELPLELRLRTRNWSHVKLHLGAKLGWQINSYNKWHPNNNNNHPVKEYNFPDRNLIRYGAYTRVGIRNWALFGAYYFSNFFTNKNSTQLSSVELGLSISLF